MKRIIAIRHDDEDYDPQPTLLGGGGISQLTTVEEHDEGHGIWLPLDGRYFGRWEFCAMEEVQQPLGFRMRD